MPSAGSVHVDVLPETKQFGPHLKTELAAVMAAMPEQDVAIRVRVDTGASMAKLQALRTLADELDGRLVRMGAGNIGGASGTSTPLRDMAGQSDRTSSVRVNTTQATTALRGVSAQVGALNGKTATVRVKIDEKSAAKVRKQLKDFSDISPAAATAASVLIPPAAPLAGAATGGAAGLLPGLGAGIMGLGGFALAAVPAVLTLRGALSDQGAAAAGGAKENKAYEESLAKLSPHARGLVKEIGDLRTEFKGWHESLEVATLPVMSQWVGLATANLKSLTPVVIGASRGLGNLADSAEKGLAGPYWQRFISFSARQAEPTLTSLGRTFGWLTLGVTGLAVSFEPLWESMSTGMENSSRSFADWANNSSNFTEFIDWTIENGPMLMGVLGDIGGAIIDVGVAISPLGLVYAQGIGLLADGLSWLAETAPGLLQLGVAAITARMALQLLTRINQGLITPLRELPGRVQNFSDRLRGVEGAATTAGGGVRGFRGALGGVMGVLGGPWGVAIAGGIAALGIFIAKKQEAKAKTDDYTAALKEDAGAVRENTRALAAKNLEEEGALELADELGIGMGLVTDAALGQTDAQSKLRSELERQGNVLAERLAAGDITQEQYDTETRKLLGLRLAIDGEADALDGTTLANERIAEATGETTAKQDLLNGSMATGAQNARDLKSALDDLTSGTVGVTEAESNFQAAVDRATDSIETNGATLDLTTEAGRSNESALSDLRDTILGQTEAQRTNDESANTMIATHKEGRKEFIKVAKEMGLTEDAANELADEYLGIPAEVATRIRVFASGKWEPGDRGAAQAGSTAFFHAEGGPVRGPGGPTEDKVPAWLSNGEFVQRTSAVNRYGLGFMSALNEGRVNPADLPGYARGGHVRTTSRTGEDAAKQINDHREDVRVEIQQMYAAMREVAGKSMAAEFKKEMSEGGMGALNRARSQRGVPYSWGGGGPSGPGYGFGRGAGIKGFDCSSLMQYAWAPWVNLPRVTYSQINSGRSVSRSQAIPGDLLFPHRGHVAMYAGNNRMFHTFKTGDVAREMSAYSNPIAVRRPTKRARGGPVESGQWSWVGEEGPELVKFSSPGQVYSAQQSQNIASDASRMSAGGDGAAPLVGEYHQHLHNGEATFRQGMAELTHTLRVQRKGGRYADV